MLSAPGRFSPGQLLLSASVICLAACIAALIHAAYQPWLGITVVADGPGLRIAAVAPNGPAAALVPGSQLLAIGPVGLGSVDLIEDPDFLDAYEDAASFFGRQSAIAAQLAAGPVTLTLADAAGAPSRVELVPRRIRPVSDLPPVFWFQLFAGSACMLIGVWVWVLRPADWGARMFALTGAMVPFSTITAAVYSTRELAYEGRAFHWLSTINHFGAMMFAAALIALFLCYPRRLVGPRVMLVVPAVFVPWLAADVFHLAPDQFWGFRLPLLLALLVAVLLVAIQWRRTRGDPRTRAALRWFSLSVILGTGLFALTTILSSTLGWLPPLRQGYAFGFFLIVYAGIALGLRRYRLFELDRWAFRILLWVGGATALIVLDAVLSVTLQLQAFESLGIALLIAGFLYLPLRNTLWRLTVERRQLTEVDLFQSVLEVAFTTSAGERAQAWHKLLRRMFDPLDVQPLAASEPAPASPTIIQDGLGLALPAAASSPALVIRYPWHGRELFGLAQVRLAEQVLQLMRHADTNREAYERGITEERDRIARDLHDDIGARLLAGLETTELEDTRRTIREAIAEMRIMMSGLSGERPDLGAMLANLRHETAERLTAAGIELDWAPAEAAEGVQVDYRICKNLVSLHRELVSNVIRHSRAHRMAVSIEVADGRFRSLVSDDGVGVGVAPRCESRGRHGLRNLRHRIEELGGSFAIESDGPGTVVRVDVPLARTKAAG